MQIQWWNGGEDWIKKICSGFYVRQKLIFCKNEESNPMKFRKKIEKIAKGVLSISPHCIYEILPRFRYWIGALCAITASPNNFGIEIDDNECVILANGPSLKDSLSDPIARKFIVERFMITVNDAISTPEFFELKPSLHAMIDPGYFGENVTAVYAEKRQMLKDRLEKVDWPLQIFLPRAVEEHNALSGAAANKHISFKYFNTGTVPEKIRIKKTRFLLYKGNKKMPNAQNVLVACIYIAINAGFKKTYLFGADHSWHEDIQVTDENIVCIRHKHFYSGNESFVPMWKDSTTSGSDVFSMAELFDAFSKTFESYEELEEYAQYMDAKIFNMSKKSCIDAFEKIKFQASGRLQV